MPDFFEQLALEAIGLSNCMAPLPLVVEWSSTIINELSRTKKMQHLKRMKELYLPPVINAGLVSATRDHNTITGDATAHAAWLSGEQMTDSYYIRIRTVWYPIGSVQGSTLILKPPALFAEDTQTNHSYVILKKYHKLDDDINLLDEHMTHARFGSPLPVITKDQMDYLYPARWTSYASSGGVPQHICEVEVSPDGHRQVEVYPYSVRSELLYYNAWIRPPHYHYNDLIPHFINYSALLEGVKLKCYEYAANREKDPQKAQLLFNIKSRQETIWSRTKDEVFLHEAAAAQGGLAAQLLRDRFVPTHRDINNAYSQVWSREP